MAAPDLLLDPDLRVWVLLPITVVMILVGILRHHVSVLLQDIPKRKEAPAQREQQALARAVNLRRYANVIPEQAFNARRAFLVKAFREGKFLKDPSQLDTQKKNQPPPNPMTDPEGMEHMLAMVKGNLANFIPQTVIMSWVNFFFSGFILMKLPFPLTIRFKSILQSGVATRDLDPRWVSSLSWYFLNLFGLKPIFSLLLGADNSAVNQADLMGGMNPAMMQQMVTPPGTNMHKLFLAEAENLEIIPHDYLFNGIENRILAQYEKQ